MKILTAWRGLCLGFRGNRDNNNVRGQAESNNHKTMVFEAKQIKEFRKKLLQPFVKILKIT